MLTRLSSYSTPRCSGVNFEIIAWKVLKNNGNFFPSSHRCSTHEHAACAPRQRCCRKFSSFYTSRTNSSFEYHLQDRRPSRRHFLVIGTSICEEFCASNWFQLLNFRLQMSDDWWDQRLHRRKPLTAILIQIERWQFSKWFKLNELTNIPRTGDVDGSMPQFTRLLEWNMQISSSRRKPQDIRTNKTGRYTTSPSIHTQETGRGETDPLRPPAVAPCRCMTAETGWKALCDPLPKPADNKSSYILSFHLFFSIFFLWCAAHADHPRSRWFPIFCLNAPKMSFIFKIEKHNMFLLDNPFAGFIFLFVLFEDK